MEVAVAGSVAKFALNLIVKTATTAITDEIGSALGVEEELRFIKQEFEMMQVFLRGVSKENVKGELMTTWIEQVQELSIDLEDCLEEATVHLIKEKNCLLHMYSVKKQNHVAKKIRVLKTRTIDVINRKQRYEQIGKENGGHTCDERVSTISISNVEALLVGLDEPKRRLINLIMKNNAEHSYMPCNEKGVISVVGRGGLGKATLVREVYGSQELRKQFKCFAWVTVERPFNKDKFIEILANQILFDAQEIDNNNWGTITEKTKEKVTEYVKENQCLIVLDDLCSMSEWHEIKDVIPPVHRSQIIVTTENNRLVESISHPSDSDNIYWIKELSEKDAFDLFCNAVYKTPCFPLSSNEGPSSNYEITEEDSQMDRQCLKITITKDMQVQAGLIIKSCDRLPLAIEIIGSYLATKPKTTVEWKTMHDQLCSDLACHRHAGVVEVVLTTIYDGMPNHLKQCLLYLSVFHKHKEIRQSRIIRRWMANGFVMEGRKRMADEVGKGYFCDLMSRSLIQPSKMSTINVDGDVKRCNIHNLIYKFIIRKAKTESMVSVLEDENHKTMTNKARHLVITGGPCTDNKVIEKVELLSNQRSVSIFGEVGNSLRYPTMKLIRVLDLEGTLNLQNRDLRSVGTLSLLKYLGLRGTKITKLPDSLGKLSELETLDIRNTAVVRLPKGLAKLKKLSYLRAGFDLHNNPKKSVNFNDEKHIPIFVALCSGCHDNHDADKYKSSGVRVPRGIGKLRSLNIFGVIDIGGSKRLAKELQNLTNLHKLAVNNFTKKNGKTLGKVIDGLKHLRSLALNDADNLGLKCCVESISSPPKYLQSLKLDGRIGKLPNWIFRLENLEKIHFKRTYLTEDIKSIEKLPNLKILHMLAYSFVGGDIKELCFGEGTFPMLQVMVLEELHGIELVSIKRTALKRIEQLKIGKWGIIQEGEVGQVSGLKFLVQLKEMEVVGYSDDDERDRKFVGNIEEQLKKLPKEPVLRVIKDKVSI